MLWPLLIDGFDGLMDTGNACQLEGIAGRAVAMAVWFIMAVWFTVVKLFVLAVQLTNTVLLSLSAVLFTLTVVLLSLIVVVLFTLTMPPPPPGEGISVPCARGNPPTRNNAHIPTTIVAKIISFSIRHHVVINVQPFY
jgi:hypothetical protein